MNPSHFTYIADEYPQLANIGKGISRRISRARPKRQASIPLVGSHTSRASGIGGEAKEGKN